MANKPAMLQPSVSRLKKQRLTASRVKISNVVATRVAPQPRFNTLCVRRWQSHTADEDRGSYAMKSLCLHLKLGVSTQAENSLKKHAMTI